MRLLEVQWSRALSLVCEVALILDVLHTDVLFEAQQCMPIDMDGNCSIRTSSSSPMHIDPLCIKTEGISAVPIQFT